MKSVCGHKLLISSELLFYEQWQDSLVRQQPFSALTDSYRVLNHHINTSLKK